MSFADDPTPLLSAIELIKPDECLGDAREKINKNFSLLSEALKDAYSFICTETLTDGMVYYTPEYKNYNTFYPYGSETGEEAELGLIKGGLYGQIFLGDYRTRISTGNLEPLPLTNPTRYASINFSVDIEYSGFVAIGYFNPPKSGSYTFSITSNDGAGLWIGNSAIKWSGRNKTNAVIDNFMGLGVPGSTTTGTVVLNQGVNYPIRIVYENGLGSGSLHFKWKGPDDLQFSDDLTKYFLFTNSIRGNTGNNFKYNLGYFNNITTNNYYLFSDISKTLFVSKPQQSLRLNAASFYTKSDEFVDKTKAPHLKITAYYTEDPNPPFPLVYSKATSTQVATLDCDVSDDKDWTRRSIQMPNNLKQTGSVWLEFKRNEDIFLNPFLQGKEINGSMIANNWIKFSHLYSTPSVYPADTTSLPFWSYNLNYDRIEYNAPNATFAGLVNSQPIEDYSLEVTLSSHIADDDGIGVVIGFYEESGKQYTLTALRHGGNISEIWGGTDPAQWQVALNLYQDNNTFPKQTWKANYPADDPRFNTPITWKGSFCKIKIIKANNVIKAYTTQFGSSYFEPESEITIDLNSSPNIEKFKKSRFGFGCISQNNSTWSDIVFTTPPDGFDGAFGVSTVTYHNAVTSKNNLAVVTNIKENECISTSLTSINTSLTYLYDAVNRMDACCKSSTNTKPIVFKDIVPTPTPTFTGEPDLEPVDEECVKKRQNLLERYTLQGEGGYQGFTFSFANNDKLIVNDAYKNAYFNDIMGTFLPDYAFDNVYCGKQYYGLKNIIRLVGGHKNELAMFRDGNIFYNKKKYYHPWVHANYTEFKDIFMPSSYAATLNQAVLLNNGELRVLTLAPGGASDPYPQPPQPPPIVKGLNAAGTEVELNNVERFLCVNQAHNGDFLLTCKDNTCWHVILKGSTYDTESKHGGAKAYGKQIKNMEADKIMFAQFGDPTNTAFVVLLDDNRKVYRIDNAGRNNGTFAWLTERELTPATNAINGGLAADEYFVDGVSNEFEAAFLTNKNYIVGNGTNMEKYPLPAGRKPSRMITATAYSMAAELNDGYYIGSRANNIAFSDYWTSLVQCTSAERPDVVPFGGCTPVKVTGGLVTFVDLQPINTLVNDGRITVFN